MSTVMHLDLDDTEVFPFTCPDGSVLLVDRMEVDIRHDAEPVVTFHGRWSDQTPGSTGGMPLREAVEFMPKQRA